VRADDADHPLAAHHLALDTDFPYRRPDLHVRELLFGSHRLAETGGTTDSTRKIPEGTTLIPAPRRSGPGRGRRPPARPPPPPRAGSGAGSRSRRRGR